MREVCFCEKVHFHFFIPPSPISFSSIVTKK